MGLFNKRTKEAEKLPQLPRLPELPNFSDFEENEDLSFPSLDELPPQKDISQLPSFPSNSLAEKFSQNTIKDAVTGQERGEMDDFVEEEEMVPMMHKPSIRTEHSEKFIKSTKSKEAEPIFIRIDKFEESLKTFEETKNQIKGLKHLLNETKELKAKEDQELFSWESELQELKSRIEKVDGDLFSKIK